MAIAQVFTATRIPTLQVWFGNILTATSSLIVIDDGFRRAIYEGTFQYNAFGEVFGTLSSYEEFENNALKFRITDINADANDLFNAIQLQANASLAAQLILFGDDDVTGSAGDDWLETFTGNDFLRGGGGDDVLNGASGNDTIAGGLGNDTVIGGSGFDTAIVNSTFANAVIMETAEGFTISDADGTDEFVGIEQFMFSDLMIAAQDLIEEPFVPDVIVTGTSGSDFLAGTPDSDSITGGDGDDSIPAGDGNDFVDAGPGNDQVGGGFGNDTIFGGDGDDVMGAGFGDDSVSGGLGNDVVAGGAGNDALDGGDGNDSMSGSFGNDLIVAGDGADDIGGGTGRDTIDAGEGNDRVGGGEGDDSILGGAGNDFLAGGGRNDTIDGGTGSDTINGGAGNDVMTGGADADQFVFSAFFDGESDVISDFEDGIDCFFIRIVNPDTGVENINNGGNGLAGFVAAMNITDTAAGAQMSVNGNAILVEGITAAQLTVDDFSFL